MLVGYYAIHPRYRNLFLLICSYVFYGWSVPYYLLLIAFSTVVDYLCGLGMTRLLNKKRWFLWFSVICNLGLLCFFKYYNFFAGNINPVLKQLSVGGVPVMDIVLPVGISFYTFQSMSYTIDVYRGKAQATANPIDFACYVALFPQLVAGPIVRYVDIANDLKNRVIHFDRFAMGMLLFMAGFAKKVLIANQAGILADRAFALSDPGFFDAWLGLLGYTLQIYFDFSGYSDMAIGLGHMFGFRFPINFDSPYKAVSITDFWRRWHITLSTWFREFLYIPLGGNRKGNKRTYVNLVITFVLSGLWHGAAWNFVLWGLFHGGFLLFERAMRHGAGAYHWCPAPLQRYLVLLIVMFSWVLFRADDLTSIGNFYSGLLAWHSFDLGIIGLGGNLRPLLTLVVGTILALYLPNTNRLAKNNPPWWVWTTVVMFLIACVDMSRQGYNPFLYFQF